jgi:hypothetical protein
LGAVHPRPPNQHVFAATLNAALLADQGGQAFALLNHGGFYVIYIGYCLVRYGAAGCCTDFDSAAAAGSTHAISALTLSEPNWYGRNSRCFNSKISGGINYANWHEPLARSYEKRGAS